MTHEANRVVAGIVYGSVLGTTRGMMAAICAGVSPSRDAWATTPASRSRPVRPTRDIRKTLSVSRKMVRFRMFQITSASVPPARRAQPARVAPAPRRRAAGGTTLFLYRPAPVADWNRAAAEGPAKLLQPPHAEHRIGLAAAGVAPGTAQGG